MTDSPERRRLSGLEIALERAKLPPQQLTVALKALEPELARQAKLSELQARLAAQDRKDKRTHALYLGGLVAGFVVVVAMLTGAVIVGVNDMPWLAAMLAGPSVLSLAGLFVLRRVDSASARATAHAHETALAAAQPAPLTPQPSPGVGPGGGIVA